MSDPNLEYSNYPTFIHADGTITIYPDGAIVERSDDSNTTNTGITNRYVVRWDESRDKGFFDLVDPTTSHQWRQSHADSGRVLVQLPKGFDTKPLSPMHAPIYGAVWLDNMPIIEKYFNSITDGVEWGIDMTQSFDEGYMICVTTANDTEVFNLDGMEHDNEANVRRAYEQWKARKDSPDGWEEDDDNE